MGLIYEKPKEFSEVKGIECFKKNPMLEQIVTCAGHQLHSNDGQFITFIPIYKPFTKADSVNMKQLMPGGNFDNIDKMHVNHIKNTIKVSAGKEAHNSWKQFVKYYTPDEALLKFNADTAVSCPIKLTPENFYLEKFNYLEALYIQKRGRGFINFFCFYTEKGKKNLPVYIKAIEGVFTYK